MREVLPAKKARPSGVIGIISVISYGIGPFVITRKCHSSYAGCRGQPPGFMTKGEMAGDASNLARRLRPVVLGICIYRDAVLSNGFKRLPSNRRSRDPKG